MLEPLARFEHTGITTHFLEHFSPPRDHTREQVLEPVVGHRLFDLGITSERLQATVDVEFVDPIN